jgi:hypothetical protein
MQQVSMPNCNNASINLACKNKYLIRMARVLIALISCRQMKDIKGTVCRWIDYTYIRYQNTQKKQN